MRTNPINPSAIVLFVLPSLRMGGGTLEAIRLASELRERGVDSRILSLWKHPNSVQTRDISGISRVPVLSLSELPPRKLRAPFDLVFLMLKFHSFLKMMETQSVNNKITVVLTHYSTLALSWSVSPPRRYCFIQGEEWKVFPHGLRRWFLRRFIVAACRRCRVITANTYLTESMSRAKVVPFAEARIWAAPDFRAQPAEEDRPIDVVVVLRRGYHKRLDLYQGLLREARREGLKSAAIACDDDIASQVARLVDVCLLRPSKEEMRSVYQRSKTFILLSETEGFGLPPLEAMGAGCVPICRDSGGVRCYMTGSLAANLIPLQAPLKTTIERLRVLLADPMLLDRLSLDARQIFLTGARQASEERERALTCLTLA
jgi:glycosyltransferase involved in cell wall biosynthesis